MATLRNGRRTMVNRTRYPAFTLIELLVVVSIIALLISILLPSLRAARDAAKAAQCQSNLRRLAVSSVIYLTENDGRYFPFRLKTADPDGGDVFVNQYRREKPRWQWFLSTGTGAVINPGQFAYLPDGRFGDGSLDEEGNPVGRLATNDYFLCPSLQGAYARDIRNGAYGYNYQYLGNSRTLDVGSGKAYVNFPVRESRIRSPGATVLLADSRGGDTPHGAHSYTLDPPRLATEHGADRFGPSVPDDGAIAHSPADARHRGQAVVAYTDGHADRMTLRKLGYDVGSDGTVVPGLGERSAADNRFWTGLGTDPVVRGRGDPPK